MTGTCDTLQRAANGRFVPGRSGNPLGKKPGTRNRATILREALRDGEDATVARMVIDKALAGDGVAARFIVGRLMPRPRGREIALDLPDISSAADFAAASNATIQAMATGEITPDEALTVTRVLEFRLKAMRLARKPAERGLVASHGEQTSPVRQKEPSPPGRHTFQEPSPPGRGTFQEPSPAGRGTFQEPSPPGRGQGEGARRASAGTDIASATRPYPNPLPTREGMRGSVHRRSQITADLLHSTCISTPRGWRDPLAA
jgi:hypothetical protein